VQSLFEYEDGSALKLTIARYYLPGGKPIEDHLGITPHVLVGPPTGEGPVQRLRARLERVPGLSRDDRAALLETLDQLPAEAPSRPVDFSGTVIERLPRDPQLEAALGVLRGRRP